MPGHWEGELNNGAGNKSVLGKVARARGMTAVAESVGVGREAMYKALRPGASPRASTPSPACARRWACDWWPSRRRDRSARVREG